MKEIWWLERPEENFQTGGIYVYSYPCMFLYFYLSLPRCFRSNVIASRTSLLVLSRFIYQCISSVLKIHKQKSFGKNNKQRVPDVDFSVPLNNINTEKYSSEYNLIRRIHILVIPGSLIDGLITCQFASFINKQTPIRGRARIYVTQTICIRSRPVTVRYKSMLL